MTPVLHLIDGNSYAYRAFYALPALATKAGRPTQAVYGFATFLLKLMRESAAEHIAVAFDPPGPTFRHKAFEKYKAQRKPTPDDLKSQFPLVHRLVELMGVPMYRQEGFEADDVLATLARRGVEAGMEVRIYSGDKDILQLVGPGVSVVVPRKEDREIGAGEVRELWGVGPDRMVDLLALMGDASDNLPGVRGVGEKTAAALLGQFGSVEALYERLGEVKSEKMHAKLAEAREQVMKTRELARLRSDVPLSAGPEDLRLRRPDEAALGAFLSELEFHSLARGLGGKSGAPPPARTMAAGAAAAETDPGDRGMAAALEGAEKVLVLPLPEADPPRLALAAGGKKWVVAWGADAARGLGGFLADRAPRKVVHGAKELAGMALAAGIEPGGVEFDTKLAAHLLAGRAGKFGPREVCREFAGAEMPEPDAGEGGPDWPALAGAGLDSLTLAEGPLRARVREERLEGLLRNVEMAVAPILARMERAGIGLDRGALAGVEKELKGRLATLEEQAAKEAGGTFNLLSPKQVAELLFKKLNLPVKRRTKTGFSTDEDVLEELSLLHPVPATILEYRRLAKVLGTYIEPLPGLCDADGLLHTTFHQTATATGRLSSSDPNLQNIPIRGDLGRRIRAAFVPRRKGMVLLSADYSQIELRILAHVSGDAMFREAFGRGADVHSLTASEMFGKAPKDVSPDERRAAKAVNFGIVYGMTAFGLARELKCPPGTAKEYLDRYFTRHAEVRAYWEKTLEEARARGYVTTLLGRRRRIQEIRSPNRARREAAEREAINHPIQGSAADIVKMAMVRVAREVPEAALLLQIHDELLFEAPAGEARRLAERVRGVMEGAFRLEVPLVAEAVWGASWGEAHG